MQFFILFWGGGQSILMNTGGRDVDELHSCEKGTLLFQFFFCIFFGGNFSLNLFLLSLLFSSSLFRKFLNSFF